MSSESKNGSTEQLSDSKVLQNVSSDNREMLIATATHFLRNPSLKSSPLSKKRAFLLQKGLTNEEIDLAIERASIVAPRSQQAVVVPHDQAPVKVWSPSIWSRLNTIGSSIIIIGVALYGLHRFYKLYIEPWLYGTENKKEERLLQMEEQLIEVNRSLSQLKRSVSAVEEALDAQKEKLCTLCKNDVNNSTDFFLNPVVLNDLKSEITSIKSLLLNRRQFPAVPSISPTIPSWQLSDEKSSQAKIKVDSSSEKNEKAASKLESLLENKTDKKSVCEIKTVGNDVNHELSSSEFDSIADSQLITEKQLLNMNDKNTIAANETHEETLPQTDLTLKHKTHESTVYQIETTENGLKSESGSLDSRSNESSFVEIVSEHTDRNGDCDETVSINVSAES